MIFLLFFVVPVLLFKPGENEGPRSVMGTGPSKTNQLKLTQTNFIFNNIPIHPL